MINGRINDVGTTPAADNLQGKGFTDNTHQLSWQLQVQSQKYPEFEAQSLSETSILLTPSYSLYESRTGGSLIFLPTIS